MRLSRREILRMAAAGTGGSVLANLAGPLIPRAGRAFAQPSALAGEAGGAILFVLNGGARTQAVFNGTVGSGANPFGSVSGLTIPLSGVQEGTGLDRPEVNARINFVTTAQHHNRTGNHDTGRTVACTGYEPEEQRPGILTILNYLFSFREIPCVHIGNDTPTTDIGTEISSTFSPIKIRSPLDVDNIVGSLLDTRVSPNEQARLDTLRGTLADRYLRSTTYQAPADIPFYQARAAEVAQRFSDDALDIRTAASMGRYVGGGDVSNGALRTTFGVGAGGGGSSFGAQAMLALRLRQLGCAGIVCSSEQNWDLHSNEDNALPPRAFDLGRAIGGLVDQMSRIEDPLNEGRTLLDTTVITVMTDFGRGNWSDGGGFNGNQGSDHVTNEDKTCLQCIPLIGGGLPGGKMLGQITSTGSRAGSSPVYETRQVLATVLDLLGIPPGLFFPDRVAPLTEELAT